MYIYIEWHTERCLSGSHTKPLANHGHCAGPAFCRLSGALQPNQQNPRLFAKQYNQLADHCLLSDRTYRVALHMLYDALHAQAAAHVQGLDV